jgi:hypothetical protein
LDKKRRTVISGRVGLGAAKPIDYATTIRVYEALSGFIWAR